jgi:glycosyltransferase involved in cell wall biosynthesis
MGLDNVHFLGHVNDMRALWEQHHALLMASRMEAGPMVVVEANLCGRLAIGPNLGAFPELIEDGVTGFLAESASQPALERAMETFLSMRPDWPEISARAFIRGKEYLRGKEYQDQSPSEAFAELILACLG